jgi:hypothetical protein
MEMTMSVQDCATPWPKVLDNALIEKFMGVLTEHYATNLPPSQENNLTAAVLDALAAVTAASLAKVGNDKRARKFFRDRLEVHQGWIRALIMRGPAGEMRH